MHPPARPPSPSPAAAAIRNAALRRPPPVSPRCGYAFERLFGGVENDDLLIDLLNACLDPRPAVVSLRRRPTATMPVELKRQRVRLWVEATDAAGATALIELRFTAEPQAYARMLNTWMALHAAQLEPGQPEDALLPVRCLWFSDRDEGRPEALTRRPPWCAAERFVPAEGPRLRALPDLTLIELPVFRRATAGRPAALEHRWLRFLAAAEARAPWPEAASEPRIARAKARLSEIDADPEQRLRFEASLLAEARRASTRPAPVHRPHPSETLMFQ